MPVGFNRSISVAKANFCKDNNYFDREYIEMKISKHEISGKL